MSSCIQITFVLIHNIFHVTPPSIVVRGITIGGFYINIGALEFANGGRGPNASIADGSFRFGCHDLEEGRLEGLLRGVGEVFVVAGYEFAKTDCFYVSDCIWLYQFMVY